MDSRVDFFSSFVLPFSRNLFILGDFKCHHPNRDLEGTSNSYGKKYSTRLSPFLLSLDDSVPPTLLHRSSNNCAYPEISLHPLLFFPAPGRCCRTWVMIPSQFSLSFFFIFLLPNEHPPSFYFQTARWIDFASCIGSLCRRISSLSLTSAALFS